MCGIWKQLVSKEEKSSGILCLKMTASICMMNRVNIIIDKINIHIHENHCFTITELLHKFPQILYILYEAITVTLGYYKFCASESKKCLQECTKTRDSISIEVSWDLWQGWWFSIRTHCNRVDHIVCTWDHTVMGDEMWVSYVNCDTNN